MSEIVTQKKRKMSTSILITVCFALGPIILPIDLIFSSLFDWVPFNATYIFGTFTIVFFLAVIFQAFRKSDEYK